MSRRTHAFSLLEALAMIVTLFVFGWLCVGVFRYDVRTENAVFGVQGLNTTPNVKADESAAKEAPRPADNPKPVTTPESKSKPAGSPASAPGKP